MPDDTKAGEFEGLIEYLIAEGETAALQKLRQVIDEGEGFYLDDLIKLTHQPQQLKRHLNIVRYNHA